MVGGVRRVAAAGTVLALSGLAPQGLSARQLPDTVRYREVTASEVRIETPQGEMAFESGHDALLAVVFVAPDSMEAWYEALALRSAGPDGVSEPGTRDFLGERFVLRYGERGRVETLATPAFPPAVARITDLRLQFEDFFPHRPDLALAPGISWADTTVSVTGEEGAETRMESVAEYRVAGDTVVAGEPHLVIRSRVAISLEGNAPTAQDPRVTVSTTLAGVEENVFVIRRADRRMWSRTRSAELTGVMAYLGMRAPVEFPMRRGYRNRIVQVGGEGLP